MSGVFQAITRTHNSSCSHCHQSSASLPCRQKSCRHSYHFHCAVAASCLFTSDTRVFCPEHATAALKRVTRHELRKIERRMSVKVSRLEVREGQLLGRAKDEREAEMAMDGEHGAFKKGKKRTKESGSGGSKNARGTKLLSSEILDLIVVIYSLTTQHTTFKRRGSQWRTIYNNCSS